MISNTVVTGSVYSGIMALPSLMYMTQTFYYNNVVTSSMISVTIATDTGDISMPSRLMFNSLFLTTSNTASILNLSQQSESTQTLIFDASLTISQSILFESLFTPQMTLSETLYTVDNLSDTLSEVMSMIMLLFISMITNTQTIFKLYIITLNVDDKVRMPNQLWLNNLSIVVMLKWECATTTQKRGSAVAKSLQFNHAMV